METSGIVRRLFEDPFIWMGTGMLLLGLLFFILGFVYEDPRYEEAGVVQKFRSNTWTMMNSGGVSGYVEIYAVDATGRRRWTLPLRVAAKHRERLLALQGKYVKVVVAGEQAKEILQLSHEGEVVIPLGASLEYKAQGRAWFGWGGVILMLAGASLWLWRWLAAGKTNLSLKTEST